jgi:glycosyltransferase involved in cell wall biosynthesis
LSEPRKITDISILIPAYNPDDRLLELVDKLVARGFEHIVVVNDGSSAVHRAVFDSLAAMHKVIVCEHEKNMGKGAALKTGIRFISGSNPDLRGIVTADADGQHLARDIQKLAEAAIQDPQKFLLGSRNFDKGTPFRSMLGNRLTAILMRFVHGIVLPDTQTGLRYLPLALLPGLLKLSGNAYQFELQCLIKARDLGFEFRTVPIETVYIEENASSHFLPVVDSLRIYSVLFRFGGSSMTCFVLDIALFASLFWLGYSAMFATVCARIASGIVNFLFNKFLVFKRRGTGAAGREALGYLVLWLTLMLISGTMVSFAAAQPTAIVVGIKLLVDVSLFLLSYYIQSRFVFAAKP